jgi:hypothetical protein
VRREGGDAVQASADDRTDLPGSEADQEASGRKAKANPAAAKAKRIKKPDQPRTLKKDRLDAMLRRPEGATIEEITEAFKNLPHSARAMISVTAKRLGVEATRDDQKAYHLPDA